MTQLKIQARFVKDAQKRLILTYDLFLNQKKLSLNLSEMMQFMYAQEATLPENISSFLYFVSKVTKKFSFQHSLIYGIKNDEEILQFFKRSSKEKLNLIITENKKQYPLSMKDELPISVILEQSGYKLHAKIMNKPYLKKHPSHFLILKENTHTYLYSSGILRKIDKRIENFLHKCLRQNTVIFDTTETINSFLQRIYKPHKSLFRWEILGSLDKLLPKEVPPTPVLTLHYDEHCLHPNLSYKYGDEENRKPFKSRKWVLRVGTKYAKLEVVVLDVKPPIAAPRTAAYAEFGCVVDVSTIQLLDDGVAMLLT